MTLDGASRPSAPRGGPASAVRLRVVLPEHLRNLADVGGEVVLEVPPPVTIGAVLHALETQHPVLRGTILEHASRRRRAFVRFFASGRDLSHDPMETELPDTVARGDEPFVVVGAMAGG